MFICCEFKVCCYLSIYLTVVDYLGYTWKMLLDFCHDDGVSCTFSGQWQALCDARKLTKGATIKFSVTGAAKNKVVYLCPPPMLILRTRMPASGNVGEGGSSYQFQEYFWKN